MRKGPGSLHEPLLLNTRGRLVEKPGLVKVQKQLLLRPLSIAKTTMHRDFIRAKCMILSTKCKFQLFFDRANPRYWLSNNISLLHLTEHYFQPYSLAELFYVLMYKTVFICTFSVSVHTWTALGMSRAVFSFVIEQTSLRRTVS